jgi:predicted nucleic acid-binding protein
MKQKLYLDTTIPSAFYDTSKPIRQLITQKWFENDANNFDLYISAITLLEIEKIKNEVKKSNIEKLIIDYNMKLLDFSSESAKLAEEYMKKGAIPKTEPEDAYHIAIAVVNNIESLASWNFSHIVSINPIRKIHEINNKLGYEIIEISSLEMFGGHKYGNL